jgi:hypothetical protein
VAAPNCGDRNTGSYSDGLETDDADGDSPDDDDIVYVDRIHYCALHLVSKAQGTV